MNFEESSSIGRDIPRSCLLNKEHTMGYQPLLQPWLGLTFALLLSIGCAAPAVTPTPAFELGWRPYDKPAEGFTVALPPTWKPIDIDPQTREAMLKALAEKNPQLAPIVERHTRNMAADVKFTAFDLAPAAIATGVMTNLQITKRPLPAEASLPVLIQFNVGALENLENVEKPIAQRRLNLPAGEGMELQYRMKAISPTGQAMIEAIIQYWMIKGKDLYIMNFTTAAEQAEPYAPIFAKIAQSFRQIP